MIEIKTVVAGPNSTKLLVAYTTKKPPGEYIPQIFGNQDVSLTVEGQQVTLGLVDLPENEYSMDSLLNMTYSRSSAVILCLVLDDPESLQAVRDRKVPEIRKFSPYGVPLILVGIRSDAPPWEGRTPEGQECAAQVNASAYFEWCPESIMGLDLIFLEAAKLGYEFWSRQFLAQKTESKISFGVLQHRNGSNSRSHSYSGNHHTAPSMEKDFGTKKCCAVM